LLVIEHGTQRRVNHISLVIGPKLSKYIFKLRFLCKVKTFKAKECVGYNVQYK
jgi:hypothetical protein